MNEILCRQLAIDYCCSVEEVLDHQNHFTEHSFLEGRRKYHEGTECRLKMVVVNGKLLFSGKKEIIDWCRQNYKYSDAAWFLEAKNLRLLNNRLHQDGYQIEQIHPYFIPANTATDNPLENISEVDTSGYEIQWYNEEEIKRFRGNLRYNRAFTFWKDAPDVIGVSASRDGIRLGMAGASFDSPTMWQIGINVDPETREAGIGKLLVELLKNEILKKGILPYYGTAFSHLASQRVALGAGFVLSWVELVTSKIGDQK